MPVSKHAILRDDDHVKALVKLTTQAGAYGSVYRDMGRRHLLLRIGKRLNEPTVCFRRPSSRLCLIVPQTLLFVCVFGRLCMGSPNRSSKAALGPPTMA
jgi:hypothetical protein